MTEKEKYITIGLDTAFIDSGCTGNANQCDMIIIQLATYLAALVTPPGYQARVKVYSNQDDPMDNDIYRDLSNGSLDIFPFEVAMNYTHMITYGYHWTTPVTSTGYVMYSNSDSIKGTMSESPVGFLISPFTEGVWACASIAAISSFFLSPILSGRRRRYGSNSKNIFLIVQFACAFLAALYSSRLKALVTSPPTSIPFQNLYELAQSIEEGHKRIIIEDKQSLRWGLLARPDMERSPPLQALYNAIHKRGLQNSVLYEPNITKVCDILCNSNQYILFAYEELVYGHCGHACVWKYAVHEYPETPLTVPVSRKSPAAKVADNIVHAMNNYRDILIRRRQSGKCVTEHPQQKFIGLKSIIGATILYYIGASVSVLIFLVELRLRKRTSGVQS